MTSDTQPTPSFPDNLRKVKKNAMNLAAAQPAVMERFEALHQTAGATGALERKIKELMALAISVTHGCDDCIAHHVHDAMEAGATREEFADTLGVAVLMGGGPAMIYASHAIEAIDQFFALQGESGINRDRQV